MPPPEKNRVIASESQIYTSKSDFFFLPIFAQNWLNIVFDPEKPGFMGVWVLGLGVRVRMEGVLY